MSKKKLKRLQFDFSEDALDRLDHLVETTDAVSRAEIVRRSLKLYEYTVEKMKNGYSLNFQKGEEVEKAVPFI